ncbi:MAG: DUF389 domain-containing protein [Chloroflexi bacterium]|nr:DUF389 domain-containing protein [Chloroflexota bacterium]
MESGYDLALIGASQESSIDKVLFGDIPGAVVRLSKRPVVIVREPNKRFTNLLGRLSWWLQTLIPRLSLKDRTSAYVRIRRNARPDVDYYMLISLASMIASLGLIVDSPAVVIGAMLVAPLMSPIIGTGLATVLGDGRFLKRSLVAVLQGVMLAILVGCVAGLITSTGHFQRNTRPHAAQPDRSGHCAVFRAGGRLCLVPLRCGGGAARCGHCRSAGPASYHSWRDPDCGGGLYFSDARV